MFGWRGQQKRSDALKLEPRPDDLSEAPVEVSKFTFLRRLAIIHELLVENTRNTLNYQLNLHGKQLSHVVRSKKVNTTWKAKESWLIVGNWFWQIFYDFSLNSLWLLAWPCLLFKQRSFTTFDEVEMFTSGSINRDTSFSLQNLMKNLAAVIFTQSSSSLHFWSPLIRPRLTGYQNNPIRRSRLVFLHDIQLHFVFVTLGVSLFRKLFAWSMHFQCCFDRQSKFTIFICSLFFIQAISTPPERVTRASSKIYFQFHEKEREM